MANTSRKPKLVDQTKIVTTASTLRIETPQSSRQKKPSVAVTVVQEVNPASGFVTWLRQNAVVGLAIGFVVGTQVQVVVKQLIESFINPLLALLIGTQLNQKSFTVHFHDRTAVFAWGTFVNVIMSFLITLLVIYLIIKFFKLDKLDQPKDKK